MGVETRAHILLLKNGVETAALLWLHITRLETFRVARRGQPPDPVSLLRFN